MVVIRLATKFFVCVLFRIQSNTIVDSVQAYILACIFIAVVTFAISLANKVAPHNSKLGSDMSLIGATRVFDVSNCT